MDILAETLDVKLRSWTPEIALLVRQGVAEMIEVADHGILDLVRSRSREQEVLDLVDEPSTR